MMIHYKHNLTQNASILNQNDEFFAVCYACARDIICIMENYCLAKTGGADV